VALDMGSMGKGQVWVNGRHAGRYWSYRAHSRGCGRCSYAGTYREDQCTSNCGDLSQRWYANLFRTESTRAWDFSHLRCVGVALQVPRAAVVAEAEREPAGGAGGVRRRPRRRQSRDTDYVNKAGERHALHLTRTCILYSDVRVYTSIGICLVR
jgi:hypothetical protein